MTTLIIALGSLLLYIIAYITYGRWLGNKVFGLVSGANVPSKELEDGQDYVPTKKGIVFGHHFTSIAGTGPIVGPAVAVMWGWVPALIWVLVGSIFIGAVHDFGALIVSMRNKGQTVGDIAGRVLTKRVRLLFLLILALALTIVLAIFGLVIALVFRQYPMAIIPCLIQIPLALMIGIFVHKKGFSILLPSLIALAVMYASVYFGNAGILQEWNIAMKDWPLMTWVVILLVYSYIASVLPVWTLLQPRDYINSLQLLSALILVILGLVAAGLFGGAPDLAGNRESLEIIAPAIEQNAAGKNLPLMLPFLFVTIACGAVSGFHCLVSSGTSSKQLSCEKDARFVGYGSMLTEGFLAVLVILACVAGLGLGLKNGESILTGAQTWNFQYADFTGMNLGKKVGAFVVGASNFLQAIGIPATFAVALMGVFVASFAATTLDTACRLQRYVLQELSGCFLDFKNRKKSEEECSRLRKSSWLTNKHVVTLFAIAIAFWMASIKGHPKLGPGSGGLILWPLFGAVNQLLAGLAFLVIVFWMRRRGMSCWFMIIPTILMLIFPAWAMAHQVFIQGVGMKGSWIQEERWLLVAMGITTLLLEAWMLIEAFRSWKKAKNSDVETAESKPDLMLEKA